MAGLTFESINKQIENLNLDQLALDIKQESIDVTSEISQIWNKIGGIIRLISRMPIIPKKWREALKLLIRTMDSICAEQM